MPAIPVAPARTKGSLARQGIFERGDMIYLTTPVKSFKPTADQIEEFAFSSQVKKSAPNENIVWFKGQYVEADNPNLNGAMWSAEELSIKSLTPMLMPVTVMHDPRTAVGTIADTKLITPATDPTVQRARIETVLALWGHRFPDAVAEAQINAEAGALMQSMECYSPWYECSVCNEVFHKLPQGAEQATWCAHLKASNPSAGFVDLGANDQRQSASRILGDVCFTGTGLIFGTRGAQGAFTEAHLENFEDELADFHQLAHTAKTRSANDMGLVQIEQSELDTLRKERDDARTDAAAAKAEVTTAKSEKEAAEAAVEAAEAAKVAAETAKTAAEAERDTAKEATARAELKDKRIADLGEGFVAKIDGMETTKVKLHEQAGTMTDEDWDSRLKEVEELTAVKRDAGKSTEQKKDDPEDKTFNSEELAALKLGGTPTTDEIPQDIQRTSVIGGLASVFGGNGKSEAKS